MPHPQWGEESRAAVVLSAPVPVENLLAFCRERLAGFKCPRRIQVLDELPRTGSGKVANAALRRGGGQDPP